MTLDVRTKVLSLCPLYPTFLQPVWMRVHSASMKWNIRADGCGVCMQGKGDLTVHRGTLRVEEGGTLVEGGVIIGSGGLGIEVSLGLQFSYEHFKGYTLDRRHMPCGTFTATRAIADSACCLPLTPLCYVGQDDGMDVASSTGTVGVLTSLNQDFHGSVLTLRSVAPLSDGFHFLRAMAGNGTRVFEVKGDGHTSIQGTCYTQSDSRSHDREHLRLAEGFQEGQSNERLTGWSYDAGGVEVASGGLVVNRGQALLGDGAIVVRQLDVRGAATVSEGLEVGGTVKEGTALLKVHANEGGVGRLMEARVGDDVVYDVAASGRLTVARGGIEVRGRLWHGYVAVLGRWGRAELRCR